MNMIIYIIVAVIFAEFGVVAKEIYTHSKEKGTDGYWRNIIKGVLLSNVICIPLLIILLLAH